MNDTEAQKAMIKARTQLVLNQPFFGTIALKLLLSESGDLPTLGTDGVKLYYNPNYVKSLTPDLLRSAVCHEVMHVVMMHPYRRQNREPIRWNIAGDYAINPMVKDAGFPLDPTWLYKEEYRGMAADTIYNKLPANKKQDDGDSGKGEGGNDQNQQGKQDQNGTGHDHDDHNHKEKPCGGTLDHPGLKPGATSEERADAIEAEANMKVTIAEAAAIAKAAGRLPGSLKHLVDEIINPRLSYADHLRRFIEEVARDDYSWVRPSRRWVHQGIYLPSLYNKAMGEMVVAIDTSASISKELLDEFLGHLSAILDTIKPRLLHVVYCDTRVANTEEYTPEDMPIIRKVDPQGRGGTDFRPPFEWVENQGIEPKCLIYFTDLECWDYPPQPDYPVLWVAKAHERYKEKVPFGEVINISG